MRLLAILFAAMATYSTGTADSPPSVSAGTPFESLDCADCSECGFGEHMMHSSPIEDPTHDGHTHSCTSSGSCSSHQPCFMQEEQDEDAVVAAAELGALAESIRVAINRFDHEALRQVVADDRVELSLARSSVQVIGCNGSVLANFPLDLATVEAVQ